MCIAVPGKVIEINDINMATIDFGGTTKAASADLVPDVKIGDYVLVHAGFIINRLDEEEAQETLKLFDQYMGILDEEEDEVS
jgi:hydrogenase expression/formation protein HypC